jgi:hypothetical protein
MQRSQKGNFEPGKSAHLGISIKTINSFLTCARGLIDLEVLATQSLIHEEVQDISITDAEVLIVPGAQARHQGPGALI